MILATTPKIIRFLDFKLRHSNHLTDAYKWQLVSLYIDTFQLLYNTQFEINQLIDKDYEMAKKFEWSFATVSLTKDQLSDVESFAETMDEDIDALADVYQEDHIKVSMSYSHDRSAWCVTLTPTEDNKYNERVSMTTWSNSMLEAIWMSGYKHCVICNRKKYPIASEAWG